MYIYKQKLIMEAPFIRNKLTYIHTGAFGLTLNQALAEQTIL